MNKLLIVFLSLFCADAAQACSMAFPAYGIYSGGTLVIREYTEMGFVILLCSAVLVKSVAFSYFSKSRETKFFMAMLAGNVLTTLIGYVMEFSHVMSFAIVSWLLMWPVFYYAIRFLRAAEVLAAPSKRKTHVLAILFSLAYLLAWFMGILASTQDGLLRWVFIYTYVCIALSLTLLVTTSYEYKVISLITKAPGKQTYQPVLKANLVIYFSIFASLTVMLIQMHRYPLR
ncbi:MAG: hypothetical protein SFY80_03000 [Verrucomicrobiota bacterium]|nr:hypothetical protein [Verrucomicrobiota bacterium]